MEKTTTYSKDRYEICHPDLLGKKGFFNTKDYDVKLWEITDEEGNKIYRVDIDIKK